MNFIAVKMRLGDRNRDRSRSPVRSRKSGCKKVFVSNIPYEYKWKELKELFKKEGITIFGLNLLLPINIT